MPVVDAMGSCEMMRVSGSRPSTLKVTRLLIVATSSGMSSRNMTIADAIFRVRIEASGLLRSRQRSRMTSTMVKSLVVRMQGWLVIVILHGSVGSGHNWA